MEKNITKRGYTLVCDDNKIDKGIKSLVDKVLLKTSYKKKNGLLGNIEILDFDIDRVYLSTSDNKFTIRMWNIEDEHERFRVTWTLFKIVKNECGSSGEELSFGQSLVSMA